MSCVAAVGLYWKTRFKTNKVAFQHGSDLDKHLQGLRLTLNKGADEENDRKKCWEASTSSNRPTCNLQMEMLTESLDGIYQRLEEIQQEKESEKRETRRRFEKLEKNTNSEFVN